MVGFRDWGRGGFCGAKMKFAAVPFRVPESGEWNTSEIARRCGVSDQLVATIAKSQVDILDLSPRKVVNKHGQLSCRRPQKNRKARMAAHQPDGEAQTRGEV
jgi:hypothetical protein